MEPTDEERQKARAILGNTNVQDANQLGELISPFQSASMNSRIDFSMLAKKLADSLLPVCSSVNGSSGGLARAQRACFFKTRFWVLSIGLTLMWPKECVTHTPTYALTGKTHINRARFRQAAELWPSCGQLL